jgi:MFS transporter
VTVEDERTVAPTSAHDRVSYIGQVRGRAEQMLEQGREISGTAGPVDRRRLRPLLRAQGVSLYPLTAIFSLSVSQLLQNQAWSVLSPDLGYAFGLGPQFFVVAGLVGQLVGFVVPLLVARAVQNRARRALVLLCSAATFALLTPFTALVTTPVMLLFVTIADTVTTSAGGTVEGSLLIDSYPPRVRVRIMSVLTTAGTVAGLCAQGLVTLLVGPLDLNWRGVFLVIAALTPLLVLVAVKLRDPGYGKYDTQRLRAAVHLDAADGDEDAGQDEARTHPTHALTLVEALRRIWLIRSMRLMLITTLVTTLQTPVAVYLA